MLSANDYVETMTIRRLNKRKPTDRIVPDQEFQECFQRLQNLIYKMAHTNHVIGFDPENLESFFAMKVHQELRHNRQYINEFSYFAKCFQNLVRNLIKEREIALRKLHKDPIDECYLFSGLDHDV